MYEEFIKEMYKVFGNTPKPSKGDMTPHRCLECDKVRDQLFEYEKRDLPDKVLDYHGDALPLLSPNALHYYLPRYMEFSLLHQDSNVFDNVLFHLAPEEIDAYWEQRINIFTNEERKIIVKYLEIRKTLEDAEFDKEWLDRGMEIWA